ncbi:hypothetical protein PVK06_020712 [Gossypium arboreum]|uniref:Aminotransferase-like plant mobile domain-containing protein n=1 Tax=Gossypium arboreum TaxID=29729 RepID=A0ABR0PN34_GOSAR|nr:hypothetical protein PVK06_020712 [Gossypium arboreum]
MTALEVPPLFIEGSYRVLRPCGHGPSYQIDAQIMPYLGVVGFGLAALIRVFELRGDLISALVERWCPKMHTFDLLCEEYTITLEDVAMQLGLHVDGDAVIGSSGIANPVAFCYDFLGSSPNDGTDKFTGLKF